MHYSNPLKLTDLDFDCRESVALAHQTHIIVTVVLPLRFNRRGGDAHKNPYADRGKKILAQRYAIQLPQLLTERLQGHGHNRLVEIILSTFSEWLARNEMIFFRDYTDHGTRHVEEVIETACGLISATALEFFSSEDAAALVCSAVLHDSALHLQEPSFVALVKDDPSWRLAPEFDDIPWAIAWKYYVTEASRLSQNQLKELFGIDTPITPPALDDTSSWTPVQYLYIGEFLRRNHARIAQQIAHSGIPGAKGSSPLESISADDPLLPFIHLSGLIARSHGMNLSVCPKSP